MRQVDEHALLSMYCALGCDDVVNRAHGFATYIKPVCSVEKDENQVDMAKFVDRKRRSPRRSKAEDQGIETRDIDAYTVRSATFRFCCTHPTGKDFTEAAAKRIGLELSICKRLS